MHVIVGPARRVGDTQRIYDRTLMGVDLSVDPDGGVALTFDACGINCQKSLYRYRIHLSAAEKELLATARLQPSRLEASL